MTFRSFRSWIPLIVLVSAAIGAWRTADAVDVDEAATQALYYDQELGTPLISPRRAPETLRAPIIDENLQPVLTSIAEGSGENFCLIVEVEDRILADESSHTPMVPASNQKLLTTYAALEILGEDHRFTTRVVAEGDIVNGVLEGNLYLVGGGDPFLSTADWWTQYGDTADRPNTSLEELADLVAGTGLASVTGSVFGDESYLDAVRYGPWPQRLLDQKQAGPLSAAAVNQGYVSWPEVFAGLNSRTQTTDPPVHAAQVFTDLLGQRDISVGGLGAGIAPGNTTLVAEIESPTLLEIVTHINSYSSNFGAEILLKHVGLASSGEGSTTAGAAAVLALLEAHEFDTTGVVVLDGSGLADGVDLDGDEVLERDLLTCTLLHQLLDSVDPNSGFAHSLSIGGERGSLESLFAESPASGQVYAKTGTLNDVTALSGYVESISEPSTTLVFSYVVNGFAAGSNDDLKLLKVPFVEGLASYPLGPTIAALRPLPTLPIPDPAATDSDGSTPDNTTNDTDE